jgi:drug/metabolite transporter (DMT)-like permease
MRICTGYQKLDLLNKSDISNFLPLYESIILMISFCIGIFFLGETKTSKEYIGFGLILGGVLTMNYDIIAKK